MPEINQIIKNNQRILIFDFLLFAKIFFHGQTDQPTDQQTFALIEAPCRSLKIIHSLDNWPISSLFQLAGGDPQIDSD